MWIDFLFLPGPRLTYDSVIRCAVKVIRFALISLPEKGPRDVAAITTAEINSKKKRTGVSEIAV